jgi:hypothetical protein
MSQDSNYERLKRILLKIKHSIHYFYINYIKLPCINLYDYIFVKKKEIIITDTSNSKIDVDIIDKNSNIELEPTITKRMSYSDEVTNDFQEVSIHRPSISMYITPDYINKSE